MDLQDHDPANTRRLFAAVLVHETSHRDRYWFAAKDFDRSCRYSEKKVPRHQVNDDPPIFHAALRPTINYLRHYRPPPRVVDHPLFVTVRATQRQHPLSLPEKDAQEPGDNREQTHASLLMPTLR